MKPSISQNSSASSNFEVYIPVGINPTGHDGWRRAESTEIRLPVIGHNCGIRAFEASFSLTAFATELTNTINEQMASTDYQVILGCARYSRLIIQASIPADYLIPGTEYPHSFTFKSGVKIKPENIISISEIPGIRQERYTCWPRGHTFYNPLHLSPNFLISALASNVTQGVGVLLLLAGVATFLMTSLTLPYILGLAGAGVVLLGCHFFANQKVTDHQNGLLDLQKGVVA